MPRGHQAPPESLQVRLDIRKRPYSSFVTIDAWRPLKGLPDAATIFVETLPTPLPELRLRVALEDLVDVIVALVAQRWGVAGELDAPASTVWSSIQPAQPEN